MASATAASKYEEITISRTKKKSGQGNQKRTITKSVSGKVTSFSYYESLYSPVVTAKVIYIDSAESTKKLLQKELEIKRDELKEKILFSTLEKIFIENKKRWIS